MAVRPVTHISRARKAVAEPDPAPMAAPEVAETEEAALPMPDQVRIGNFVHTIAPMDPMKSVQMNRIGEYDTLNLHIEVLQQMPKQRLAETLVHEIFHGLWHVTGLRQDEGPDEEHAVTVLSMATVGLIRDNPEVIAWIMQNLGDE